MGKFVFMLKLIESFFKILLTGSQAFTGRILLADLLDCLLQFLFNLFNRFLLLFEVPAGPDKVYEEQDDSAVVMVA